MNYKILIIGGFGFCLSGSLLGQIEINPEEIPPTPKQEQNSIKKETTALSQKTKSDLSVLVNLYPNQKKQDWIFLRSSPHPIDIQLQKLSNDDLKMNRLKEADFELIPFSNLQYLSLDKTHTQTPTAFLLLTNHNAIPISTFKYTNKQVEFTTTDKKQKYSIPSENIISIHPANAKQKLIIPGIDPAQWKSEKEIQYESHKFNLLHLKDKQTIAIKNAFPQQYKLEMAFSIPDFNSRLRIIIGASQPTSFTGIIIEIMRGNIFTKQNQQGVFVPFFNISDGVLLKINEPNQLFVTIDRTKETGKIQINDSKPYFFSIKNLKMDDGVCISNWGNNQLTEFKLWDWIDPQSNQFEKIILGNMDILDGTVTQFNEKTCEIITKNQILTVPSMRIKSFYPIYAKEDETFDKTHQAQTLYFENGFYLSGNIQKQDPSHIYLKTDHFEELMIPLSIIKGISFSPSN